MKRDEIERRLREYSEAHPPDQAGLSAPVLAVLQRVHERLFDPRMNVNAIKSLCQISDNNISCRFKFEVGMSLKSYIEIQRLEAARALLEEGDCSVSQAAQAVGYVYLQTFYAAFCRHFPGSPGSLRRDSSASAEPPSTRP